MPHPLIGMLIVLATLGGLIGLLRLLQAVAAPHPELLRKLLHMGMGVVMAALPWLFDQAWPVWVLAGVSIGLLLSIRFLAILRSRLGGVLGAVDRASWGEVYYPLGVATVFTLSLHDPQLSAQQRVVAYVIPILLLGLADAAAALVGVAYGTWRYTTLDGHKSLQGSLAFLLSAFLCALIPLLLTDVGWIEALCIALLLGFLAMLFEAIAWRGLDNLLLPVIGYLLLRVYLTLSLPQLLDRLALTAALVVLVLVYRRRTTLAGSGLLAAVLFGYVAGVLGGLYWILAPLTLFLTHRLLIARDRRVASRIHQVDAVLSVASTGLIWLLTSVGLNRPELLYPYTLGFSIHLAIIAYVRLRQARPAAAAAAIAALSIAKAWALIVLPFAILDFWQSITGAPILCAAFGLAVAAMGLAAFLWTEPLACDRPATAMYWVRQASFGLTGSCLGLVPLYVLKEQSWLAW